MSMYPEPYVKPVATQNQIIALLFAMEFVCVYIAAWWLWS